MSELYYDEYGRVIGVSADKPVKFKEEPLRRKTHAHKIRQLLKKESEGLL